MNANALIARMLAATVLTVAISSPGAPVTTTPPQIVDSEIAFALAHEPGGFATSEHTAYWPTLGMTMESSLAPRTLAVGSCATGSFCAYSALGLTGAKLSWGTCGTYSTAAISSAKSVANARTTGNVQALSSGTVVATVAPGKQSNVSLATHVRCA